MKTGIAGSARIEGVGRASGVPSGAGFSAGGTSIVNSNNDAVKKAVVIWVVAVGFLLIMHVGGSALE